jgi:peroxiredoxin
MTPLLRIALSSCLVFPLIAQEPDAKPAPASADKQEQEAPKTLQLGQRVNGATTLKDLDGKPLKAMELMGKVTVVNFYSIQCPIQRAWDKRLAEIQTEFAKEGVVFLHIDSNVTEIGAAPPAEDGDEEPYAKVKEHLKKQELPFRVLADHGNKVADMFDAKTTPHIYVFGRDGKLVYKGLVDDDQKNQNAEDRKNYLRDVLGSLLKGEKVEPFATKEVGCTIKRVSADGGGRSGRRGGRRGGSNNGGGE